MPSLGAHAADLSKIIQDKLIEHARYIRQHGEDMPEIRNWKWSFGKSGRDTPVPTAASPIKKRR